MNIGASLLSKAIGSANLGQLLGQVLSLLPEEEQERTGGYFTIYHPVTSDHTSYEMFGRLVGLVPKEKEDRYRAFSAEKALRLSLHDDHVSSFQSCDGANNKWPGAVRKEKESDIFSFSGLPWKADEAFVLAYCVKTGELTCYEAYDIAKISENDVYEALMMKDESLTAGFATKHP
ncbi:MAG: hypothetical protein Q7K33_02895 [Candidatus Berkelbacteria bacterium]|nr:hypothetical protein [Candidatus Berkelbacteria bacterium]